jgi:tetratricopeptide (TPR) repeat protein
MANQITQRLVTLGLLIAATATASTRHPGFAKSPFVHQELEGAALDRAVRDYLSTTKDPKLNAFCSVAHIYFSHGRYNDAIAYSTNALKIAPRDANLCNIYNTRALAYFQQKRYERVVADADEAIKVNAPPVLKLPLYKVRAEANFALGRYREALNDNSAALNILEDLFKLDNSSNMIAFSDLKATRLRLLYKRCECYTKLGMAAEAAKDRARADKLTDEF